MSNDVIIERTYADGNRFQIVRGNLLDEPVDGIVNAANGALMHGGGVAGVIARAAGPDLVEESSRVARERGQIPTGDAALTTAGDLPFKGVVHVVGPRKGEGDEETLLVSGLRAAFDIASDRGWTSLSFPAVSSGIFAVPAATCVRGYRRAVEEFFAEAPGASLSTIRLCLFDAAMVETVKNEMGQPG